MKVEFDPQYAEVIGSYYSVAEIAEALTNLKASSFDERYDIYSELYREHWATNAGYVLLPALYKSLGTIEDVVDLEVAFVVGSIQSSVLKDQEIGAFEPIVAAFVDASSLEKTILHLRQGTRFCSSNLPVEQCESLIAVLQSPPDSDL